ncbi:hypothetical protein FKW77_002759 [Venturia effusa]|uniref:F-box domain-containing protein n=1 Tax=Venturia effusa TaxID=50376 RepID=A0A517LDG9_9PEZI|nr:hypothetical protein FKW77_002759 [Venturia effusa]
MKLLKAKHRQKLTEVLRRLKKKPDELPPAILEAYPTDIIDAIADKLTMSDFCNLRLVSKTISLSTLLLFTRKYLSNIAVDFTRAGLQSLLDWASHYDISETVHFGSRITKLSFSFEHFVWTSNEEDAWMRLRRSTTNPIHRRSMKAEARKSAQEWRTHREMLKESLYSRKLEEIFRHVPSVTVQVLDERLDDYDGLEGTVMVIGQGRFKRPEMVSYMPSPLEGMDRLTFFLQELFAALQKSNAQLLGLISPPQGGYERSYAYLPIERFAGVIKQHEALPRSVSSWTFLGNCAVLDVSVSYLLDRNSSVEDQQTIVRMFKEAAQSLTRLCLRGIDTSRDTALLAIVDALVKEVHFPKLAHVQFDNGNVQAESLVAFFRKHSNTLQSFILTLIYTSSGAWPSIFTYLYNCQFPRLETMRVVRIGERQLKQKNDGSFDLGEDGRLMIWRIWPGANQVAEYAGFEEEVIAVDGLSRGKLKWMAETMTPIPTSL